MFFVSSVTTAAMISFKSGRLCVHGRLHDKVASTYELDELQYYYGSIFECA